MKPKPSGTLAMRLIFAALLLAVIVYFGLSLTAYMMEPYKTTVTYNYVGENAVAVSGYVVREEEALSGSGELVYSSRGEGERVSAGGTAALIYQNARALEEANTLRSLEEQLEQLLYAQTLSSGAQAAARLDDEITSALLEFRESLADGSLTAAAGKGETLRAAVLKRSYAYASGDLQESIAGLREQIAALSAAASPGTTRVTAPKAGLFSSLVDGYEGVLNPDMARELTPSGFRAVEPAPVESGQVGKIVYGSKWYFLTVMKNEDIRGLEPGDSVTLRFQKGLDRDMSMKIDYISNSEGGQRVVLLVSGKYLNLTTQLRDQNAQIIFDSYNGIRVPRSSVRVEAVPVTDEDGNPVLDNNGNPKTENVTCVYSLWGVYARRKPVVVLWQEDEYILVVPDEAYLNSLSTGTAQEGRRLRAGDQVITAAADLYDGKVIR